MVPARWGCPRSVCPSWWAWSDTEHRCRKADVPFLCAQGQGAASLHQAWGLTPWEREPGMLSDKESCAGKWVRARWHPRRWHRRLVCSQAIVARRWSREVPTPRAFPVRWHPARPHRGDPYPRRCSRCGRGCPGTGRSPRPWRSSHQTSPTTCCRVARRRQTARSAERQRPPRQPRPGRGHKCPAGAPRSSHLLELVDAEDAAGVSAVRANLLAEAGGQPRVFDGQILRLQPLVPVQGCDGLLRGGDEVLLVDGAVLRLLAALANHLGSRGDRGDGEEPLSPVPSCPCTSGDKAPQPWQMLGAASTGTRAPRQRGFPGGEQDSSKVGQEKGSSCRSLLVWPPF